MISSLLNTEDRTKTDSLYRRTAIGHTREILTDIYKDETNIAIWQRDLSEKLVSSAIHVLDIMPTLKTAIVTTPKEAYTSIYNTLGASSQVDGLSEDIAQLLDMFCFLFDLKHAGLRLTALDHAMCPRFHVDRVPCRLVTTYCGRATQWLEQHCVDRSKLGTGSQGKSDLRSGLFKETSDIQQLGQGDVALLKGELWEGNEGAGLVHRSPEPENDTHRLLITLDFIND